MPTGSKCLFVSNRWPDPLAEFRHGTALRMRMLLRAAQSAGLTLDLMLYAPPEVALGTELSDRLQADFLRHWGLQVAQVHLASQRPGISGADRLWAGHLRPALGLSLQPPFDRMSGGTQAGAFARVLKSLQPDLLFVHRLHAMLPVLRAGMPLPPTVFDLDDIEHKAFARLLAQPPHWRAKRLKKLWLPALRRAERQAITLAQRTFVCSAADAAELKTLYGSEGVRAIANALPLPPLQPLPAEPSVLFLGVYDHEPNRMAAEWLVQEIWPLVTARVPAAKLRIAGKHAELIRLGGSLHAGVEVLGFVDDLSTLYARTRVVACPLLSGAGTRIKIIEGALHGRPVVSTGVGAEGLELRSRDEEVVIADGAEAFAEALTRLLGDMPACQRIGAAARARAVTLYDERQVIARIAAEISEVLRESAGER